MSAVEQEPEVWLIRHGETKWSRSGQHTGTTDLALTPIGEAAARTLRPLLSGRSFDLVLCSPMQRAQMTAELAGVRDYEIDESLVEWNYGEYEGRTRIEIQRDRPDWSIWTHGAPGGETPAQVTERVDRLIGRLRDAGGRTLLFAHGHIMRSLAARWVGQPVSLGANLPLDTAKVSVLSWDRGAPTIDRWNSDS